jgi:hypothetical protein
MFPNRAQSEVDRYSRRWCDLHTANSSSGCWFLSPMTEWAEGCTGRRSQGGSGRMRMEPLRVLSVGGQERRVHPVAVSHPVAMYPGAARCSHPPPTATTLEKRANPSQIGTRPALGIKNRATPRTWHWESVTPSQPHLGASPGRALPARRCMCSITKHWQSRGAVGIARSHAFAVG